HKRRNGVGMAEPLARTQSRPPLALGKYTPFARLGNGGMADVYLAAARGPVGFNKLVVIKRMRDSEEPRVRADVPRRSSTDRAAQSPERRSYLRGRRGQRDLLHCNGVPRRTVARQHFASTRV